MKTLADLKRDLKEGAVLTLTERNGEPRNDRKKVIEARAGGVSFATEKDGVFTGKAALDFPAASLLAYNGKNIVIYSIGERELTETEKALIANMPSHRQENAKQCEIDVMSDGSTMYWRDKAYTKENNIEWYWKDYNYQTKKRRDKQIKGAVSLKYKMEEARP